MTLWIWIPVQNPNEYLDSLSTLHKYICSQYLALVSQKNILNLVQVRTFFDPLYAMFHKWQLQRTWFYVKFRTWWPFVMFPYSSKWSLTMSPIWLLSLLWVQFVQMGLRWRLTSQTSFGHRLCHIGPKIPRDLLQWIFFTRIHFERFKLKAIVTLVCIFCAFNSKSEYKYPI